MAITTQVTAIEKKEIPINKTHLEIAVAGMISPEQTFSVYQELMDYISNKMSVPVIMKQRKTYAEINSLLGTGRLDAAILCSGTYVHARNEYQIKIIAVPVINGSPTYHSYIIVHNNSPVKNFKELKGKTFAFTDPLSNSGYMYPAYLVSKENYSIEKFFSKSLFTYSHDNSIEAVAEKIVDGAAVDSLIYDYMKLTNQGMITKARIILKSPPFGAPPVAVPASLPQESIHKLQNIFLNMNNDQSGRKILDKLRIDKFISGNDKLYDSIRHMHNILKTNKVMK